MRTPLAAIMFSATILLPTLGFAAGGGGGSSGGSGNGQQVTCPKGEVYSSIRKRCVPKLSEMVPDREILDQAWALARNSEFDAARELFELAANRENPEVLNGLGYTNRKLGLFEIGIGYYKQALNIDPNYLQVREYLGEGYVSMGKLDLAREQLAEIEKRGGKGTEYHADLVEAIETAVKASEAQ
jgi:tetratricopeptide (TPR) repeat protein